MYELIQVSNNTYYVNCPAKIGLFRCDDGSVYLIDSGNDKEAGRKVRQILDRNGWKLQAILCTHSHADHIGGCKYLQTQTGCKVYASGIECCFTRHTLLEPSYIYGGFPPKALRHKFLMAQESDVQDLSDAVLPDGFEIIPLPGHSFDMVGFRTPDNVVFLGDCLSSRATLEKYRIGFLCDVQAYLDTLETVKGLSADLFVPAHAEVCNDAAELAQYNIDTVTEIAERIVSLCSQPVNFEKLLKMLFDEYALQLSFEQYALVGSTVKSYLAWLMDSGRLNVKCEDNMLLWEAAE